MKPLNNFVAIRADADSDRVGNLRIDTSWNPENHFSRSGIVEHLPELKFNLNRSAPDPMEVDVPMELQVGDRVWFHHASVSEGEKTGFLREQGLIPVRYDLIFLYERDGVKHACAGYLIYKPIEIKMETSLHIPDSARKFRKDTFEVLMVGCHVNGYRKHILWDDRMKDDHNVDIKVGDIIVMEPYCNIPIQHELHANLFQGERFVYRERRCNVVAVLDSLDKIFVK
jgi:hypothetical protein